MHPRVQELLAQSYADQRSQEWLDLRGNLLTASDLATAIGLNPYEKPEGLLAKKCGAARPWAGNEATAHGTRLEPMVRDLYDMRHGQISHEIGLVQHPVHKFLGGSPDGITESGRLLEIKCPLSRKIKPEVPGYYLPQIQLLLEIMDLEVCDFLQYKEGPPEEFVVVEVPRDREWFAHYLPVMKAFWDSVLAMRKKGICDVEIDEITIESNPVEECEVELELN
jgi:putative phage-type endonuclease